MQIGLVKSLVGTGYLWPWPTFQCHRPPSCIFISGWLLMNHYSLDIAHADWSSQELGWDWSSAPLTYLPRSQSTIVHFHLWMITYELLQLGLIYCTCWLVYLWVWLGLVISFLAQCITQYFPGNKTIHCWGCLTSGLELYI